MPTPVNPARPGAVVWVSDAASRQFTVPFPFEIIAVKKYGHTPDGWVWLDGNQLDPAGRFIERRRVFVQVAGLWITQRPPTQGRNTRKMPPTRQTTAEDAILSRVTRDNR